MGSDIQGMRKQDCDWVGLAPGLQKQLHGLEITLIC